MNALKYANTEAGRFLLGIKHNLKIIKLTPNSYHALIGFEDGKPLIYSVNWSGNFVKRKLLVILELMHLAGEDSYEAFLHYAGFYRKSHKYPQIHLVTNTFFDNTGEGELVYGSAASWATAHDAASATSSDTTTLKLEEREGGSGSDFNLRRLYTPVNTSGIPNGSVVSAATYSLYRDDSVAPFVNDFTESFNIVTINAASVTSITNADYGTLSTTSLVAATLASTTNVTYKDLTLPTANVVTGGHTKLGILGEKDRSNTTISNATQATISFQSRGAANPVKLAVTYIPTGGYLGRGAII